MKKFSGEKKEYALCPAAIDAVAEEVSAACEKFGVERKEALRFRLSIEESLGAWLRELGEGAATEFEIGRRLGRPCIRIRVAGAALNPYNSETEEFGHNSSVLAATALFPVYSFSDGVNMLTFTVKRKALNPLLLLLLVIVSALAVGMGGRLLLPEAVIGVLCNDIISPIEDTMFRILSCIAGPMIFLSVAWGIYGIGDVYTLGRVGKKLMLNYLLVVFLFALFGCVFYPLLGPALSASSSQSSQFETVFEMLLSIFPGNIFSPFVEGNTLQIILLAAVIGVSLIFLGQRTASVARAVEQINNIINFLMNIISRFVPYFVFVVLLRILWSGDLATFGTVWRFAVVFVGAEFIAVMALCAYVSVRNRVRFGYLLRACLPSYLIALTTASSSATFDSNMSIIRQKLGVRQSLAAFSVPFGMVMFKPNTGMYYILICFYLSSVYGVSVSIGWIVIALVIASISAVATPPIPGGAAATYTVLLLQLGIPSEALAVILAVDMIFDFLLTSGDMLSLLLETFHVSCKIGMQDRTVLEKAKGTRE